MAQAVCALDLDGGETLALSIARRLAISPRTVETHRGRLLDKFGVDSTFALFAQFVTADMVDGEA